MITLMLYIIIKSQKRSFNEKMFEIKEKTAKKLTKKELILKISLGAVLIAIGTILKFFSISTGEFRFGFYEIPVLLSGFLLGPLFGGLVGIGVDLIYWIFSGYNFSLIMMCSSMLWGVMGGLLFYKKTSYVSVLIICLITGILTTSINSVQLYIYYGMGMFANLPIRIITMLIKWPIISTVVWLLRAKLMKNIKY